MADRPIANATFEKPVVIGPVGRCIYGADHSRANLSREHVFPFGLGGGLILLKACCGDCQKAIHKFETVCVDKHFGNVRELENMPSRNRKARTGMVPAIVTRGGRELNEVISASLSPTVLVLPEYLEVPGLFRGSATGKIKQRPRAFAKQTSAARRAFTELKADAVGVTIPVDEGAFVRLLAKIAHGSMVAAYGADAATPLLLGIILRNELENASYVMGLAKVNLPDRKSGGMHSMDLRSWLRTDGGGFVIGVSIRLFSHIPNTPTYLVMAGTSKELLKVGTTRVWTRHFSKDEG